MMYYIICKYVVDDQSLHVLNWLIQSVFLGCFNLASVLLLGHWLSLALHVPLVYQLFQLGESGKVSRSYVNIL